MTEISLVLPTRGRPALVSRLLESIVHTTAAPERLEVVALLDTDDDSRREIQWPDLGVERLLGPPGRTMGSMTRTGFEASRGRYVMLLNDDVVFRTAGWDVQVTAAFGQFADDIALVYGNDLDQGRARPTLPFLSRVVADLIGGVCPLSYHNLHIESHLFDIFRQLARLGQPRIVYLGDVVFEHMHCALGKSAVDSTSIKRDKQHDDVLFISLDGERRHLARRIARHIDSGASSQPSVVPVRI
jgi:hypothetical protein